MLLQFFYNCIIYVVLDIFTRYHSVVFILHGEIRYFRHGQGGDGMMQDSPSVHKNYTQVFYIQNEISTCKLNNFILACIRATSGTLKIYTSILRSHSILVIWDICLILQILVVVERGTPAGSLLHLA